MTKKKDTFKNEISFVRFVRYFTKIPPQRRLKLSNNKFIKNNEKYKKTILIGSKIINYNFEWNFKILHNNKGSFKIGLSYDKCFIGLLFDVNIFKEIYGKNIFLVKMILNYDNQTLDYVINGIYYFETFFISNNKNYKMKIFIDEKDTENISIQIY